MKFDVIRKAIIVMLSDQEAESMIRTKNKSVIPTIVDYALHFEKLFYENEVDNMVDFFNKMYHGKIFRQNYFSSLDNEIKKNYSDFIDYFIERYKKTTSEELSFSERKIILQSTLNTLKEQLQILKEGMIGNLNYNETTMDDIYRNNIEMISNIEHKLRQSNISVHNDSKRNSNSVSTFLGYIKKANMHYIITLSDGKIIYPFLYDLLLHLFLIDTRLAINSSSYLDRKAIHKHLKKVRENFFYSHDDSRYMDIEYLKVSELLTYIEPKDLKQFLLYHYSSVVKCEYSHILSVFKQLKYDVTDHHKYTYTYKDFSFVENVAPQDMRYLSLYVNLN